MFGLKPSPPQYSGAEVVMVTTQGTAYAIAGRVRGTSVEAEIDAQFGCQTLDLDTRGNFRGVTTFTGFSLFNN